MYVCFCNYMIHTNIHIHRTFLSLLLSRTQFPFVWRSCSSVAALLQLCCSSVAHSFFLFPSIFVHFFKKNRPDELSKNPMLLCLCLHVATDELSEFTYMLTEFISWYIQWVHQLNSLSSSVDTYTEFISWCMQAQAQKHWEAEVQNSKLFFERWINWRFSFVLFIFF